MTDQNQEQHDREAAALARAQRLLRTQIPATSPVSASAWASALAVLAGALIVADATREAHQFIEEEVK